MRILLVEDDPRIVLFVGESLEEDGHDVTVARDGEEVFLAARLDACDLIILDLTLPRMDGLEVARRLRASGVALPLLMLTARARERDTIAGLDAGADDYLTKPFRLGELRARVRVLLRRADQFRARVLRVGTLEMDTRTRAVRRAGRAIDLSAREYALLEYLLHNRGRVLSRAQLEAAVWRDGAVASNVVEVYVAYLRRKIDAPSDARLIHTIRGSGYALREPDAPALPGVHAPLTRLAGH